MAGCVAGIMPAMQGPDALATTPAHAAETQNEESIREEFFLRREELTLKFRHTGAQRRLSFARFKGTPQAWKKACRDKLAELIGFSKPAPCRAKKADWKSCSQIRNSNTEMRNKPESPKPQIRIPARRDGRGGRGESSFARTGDIRISFIRICFGFRVSCFEFPVLVFRISGRR
ncbi:MAG: hypothetical protein GXY19_03375 [Phycisphaerae bacterium]|nr:hypothetical protein [Phycisphaerae bacterium]